MNGSHFLLLEITTTESLMQKMLSLISQISLLSNGLKLTRYRFTHKVSVFSVHFFAVINSVKNIQTFTENWSQLSSSFLKRDPFTNWGWVEFCGMMFQNKTWGWKIETKVEKWIIIVVVVVVRLFWNRSKVGLKLHQEQKDFSVQIFRVEPMGWTKREMNTD